MSDTSNYFENGYALFIGIAYHHWVEKGEESLSALNDTKMLYDHFTDPKKAAYNPEKIELLSEEKATRTGILEALDRLIEKVDKDKEATAILYYAGHGETVGSDFFLLPYDFNLEKWWDDEKYDEDNVINSTEFAEKVNAIRAKKLLVILDCCHSENMVVTSRGIKKKGSAFLDELTKDLEDKLFETPATTRGVSKEKLKELNKGRGRAILTSCKADEKSIDIGSNGLFTKVLLECLRGEYKYEKDGWIRFGDLMYVLTKVPKEASKYRDKKSRPYKQHPLLKRAENLEGNFIICAYNIAKARGLDGNGVSDETKGDNDDNKSKKSKIMEEPNKKEEAINLIDEDIEEAFDILDDVDWGNKKGTYNDLCTEYEDRPGNFQLSTFRSKLKRFVKRHWK